MGLMDKRTAVLDGELIHYSSAGTDPRLILPGHLSRFTWNQALMS